MGDVGPFKHYTKPCYTMLSHNSLNFNRQSLEALAAEMLGYSQQQALTFCPGDCIESINERLGEENEKVRSIGLRMHQLIVEWLGCLGYLQETIYQLNDELDLKIVEAQNLQEALTHLEQKVLSFQQEYLKAKNKAEHLTATHQEHQQKWNQEKALLIESQQEAKTELGRLQMEKQLLCAQLHHCKGRVDSLEHQTNYMSKALEQKNKQLETERAATVQLYKAKEKLAVSLHLCQEALNASKRDRERTTKATSDKPMKKLCRNVSAEHLQAVAPTDLPYSPLSRWQWLSPGNCPLSNESKRRLGGEVDCMELDPYFAHFVLTSQSVKIKQDCEQMLNIDVKPYYQDIVEKRIPMHLWDQWIRNKLRLLRKLNKKNSTRKDVYTSEDDVSV